jgi:hypothetical protein
MTAQWVSTLIEKRSGRLTVRAQESQYYDGS